jgi:hypothetical protein
MDAVREHAYRLLLSAGMLHVKWDLACFYGGFTWKLRHQVRRGRRAACRSVAFHNLAIFATYDFVGFSEERFWGDIERFLRNFPESPWSNYREIFEHALLGEPVHIIAPDGGISSVAVSRQIEDE